MNKVHFINPKMNNFIKYFREIGLSEPNKVSFEARGGNYLLFWNLPDLSIIISLSEAGAAWSVSRFGEPTRSGIAMDVINLNGNFSDIVKRVS